MKARAKASSSGVGAPTDARRSLKGSVVVIDVSSERALKTRLILG